MGVGAKGIDCLGEATHSIRRASQAGKVLLLSDSIRLEQKRILGLRRNEYNGHPVCTVIEQT